MICNNSLLHSESDQRAWPRGLQNTVPVLASTRHIRQLIKEKQEQQVGIKGDWQTQLSFKSSEGKTNQRERDF